MRPIAVVAVTGAVIGCTLLVSQTVVPQALVSQLFVSQALAQGTPSLSQPSPLSRAPEQPATEGAAVPQAPIGHRQPSLRSLPPDLQREQQLGGPSRAPSRDPAQPPSICRGC
jgi:hypothetical protein